MINRKFALAISLVLLAFIILAFYFAWKPEAAPIVKSPPSVLTEEPLAIDITPSVESSSQCAYTWAYKDLPEISAEFKAAVKALLPEADGHASAFGEDCLSADGRAVSFGAMETDFYVIIPVSDLNDNDALGNVVAQLLPIMDNFPLSKLSGPKEGFLEITFRAGEDQRVFRIPLPRGRELREQSLSGVKLIEAIQQ